MTTEWLLKNFDASYKVILVGDAAMSPYELKEKHYDWKNGNFTPSGLERLIQIQKQYPYLIWLNPEPMPQQPGYWTQTHWQIGHMLPMYELSAHGLETGMKRLMAKK